MLDAAREVFAEGGLDAPLSAVARRAGVGQGSLYRHFPDRVDLALAVFEQNVDALEAISATPGSDLDDLLALVTDQAIEAVAFVDLLGAAGGDERLTALVGRVAAAVAGPLDRARAERTVRDDLTADEVLLAVGMTANLLARTPAGQRRATADAAWAMLRRGMAPGR